MSQLTHGHAHGAHHGHNHGRGHVHRGGIRGILEGAFMPHSHDAADKVDTALESSERGIWAVKVSLIILGVTTALQGVVVALSGSVALLADTIHNFGDAMTAVPLWTAFALSRRPPTKRYTYGFHRSEDIAGVLVVGLIAFSAAVAADQAIDRLLHPQPITDLGWVMAAGMLGFVGNEVVAVFRIRIGKEIGSAALIADGYHARTDGFTSLAVVIGAAGVYLGWPMADPIVGLAITIAILGIVWQSAREILRRIMDGVEPEIVERLVKAALLYGVRAIKNVRVRWLGHQLEAELVIAVDGKLSTQASHGIAEAVKRALVHAEPKLRSVLVCVHPQDNNPQAKAELQPPALNPRTEGDL